MGHDIPPSRIFAVPEKDDANRGKAFECTKGAKFVVEKTLEPGAWGQTYVATGDLGNRVVIKQILEDALKEETAVKRFEREIMFMASLPDPNIVTLIAAELHATPPWYVMEFAKNGSLQQWLKNNPLAKRTPQVTIWLLNVFTQIARALRTAHTHNPEITHRDIKPANILLWCDSEVAKLSDFGLAIASNTERLSVKRGPPTGTTAYMSPEQARGDEPSSASDIYSLAITFYECLTGRVPVPRDPHIEDTDYIKALGTEGRRLFGELNERMMKWEPTGRPTADAVVNDLVECQHAYWRTTKAGPHGVETGGAAMPTGFTWRAIGWRGQLWDRELTGAAFHVSEEANGDWRLENVGQLTGETRCKAVMQTVDIRNGPIEFQVNPTKVPCELGICSAKGQDVNRLIKLDKPNMWHSIRMESKTDTFVIIVNGKSVAVEDYPVGRPPDSSDVVRPYIRVDKGQSVTVRYLKQEISRRFDRSNRLVLPPATYTQAVANGVLLHYYDETRRDSILNCLPESDNLAREGKAVASSNYDARIPQNVFRGVRDQDSWLLDSPSGSFEASWTKPVKGRYLVLIGRLSNHGSDKWQQAGLSLNGRKIATLMKDFSGHGVLVIELGKPVAIRHFRADIPGAEKPGLVGLEIFA